MTREEELKELEYRKSKRIFLFPNRDWIDSWSMYCRTCYEELDDCDRFKYCPYCGQKLDWSVLDD